MTTDLLQEAVALLRALADHNVTYWSDDGEARFNPGKNQADSMRIFREARAFLAKIDAMPAGETVACISQHDERAMQSDSPIDFARGWNNCVAASQRHGGVT